MIAKRVEGVALAGQLLARDFQRIESTSERRRCTAAKFGVEKAEIEGRIMCDKARAAGEGEKVQGQILEHRGSLQMPALAIKARGFGVDDDFPHLISHKSAS